MDDLLEKVSEVLEADMSKARDVYHCVANSKYRPALMEILLERKEFIRSRLDPTAFEAHAPSIQIDQMLRALNDPVLPAVVDDERDEEITSLEDTYRNRMNFLRNLLQSYSDELQRGCRHIMLDIHRVLRSQQMLRPIDEQVTESLQNSNNVMKVNINKK
ncbi:PBC domain-containing protein [Trichostrongylus colubriformis]|uniref:PBC domain-containing protein n=1 Tax=Trichostrongylus colubriformis TaxID=6319 RepID=A0AAN8IEI1_TRICO